MTELSENTKKRKQWRIVKQRITIHDHENTHQLKDSSKMHSKRMSLALVRCFFCLISLYAASSFGEDWRRIQNYPDRPDFLDRDRDIDIDSIQIQENLLRYTIRYSNGASRQIIANCGANLRAEPLSFSEFKAPNFSQVYPGTASGRELELACKAPARNASVHNANGAPEKSTEAQNLNETKCIPVEPSIPSAAIVNDISGTVQAKAKVIDGVVQSVTIVSGPKIFYKAVEAALMQYKCSSQVREFEISQTFVFKGEGDEAREKQEKVERERVTREQAATALAAQRQKEKEAENEKKRLWLLTPEGKQYTANEEKAAKVAAEIARQEDLRKNKELARDYPYYAVVSCSVNNRHISILGCFSDPRGGTEIELTNGKEYGLYKVYQLQKLGAETRDGMIINLRRNFKIVAQNSSDNLILGVKVFDRNSREVLFQKQVARFGTISVQN